jgi:hypothetical protein
LEGSKGALDWLHAHADELGLNFPMMGQGRSGRREPWHVELSSGPSVTNNVNVTNNLSSTIHTQPGKTGAEAAMNIFGASGAHWSDILSNATRQLTPNMR